MSELFASGIRPAIDTHLLKLAAEKRDYGEFWSASSAGYCHRKLIFERLGVPHTTEDDPRVQRVFSAGHLFHSWIQELTRDAGLSIAQEVELQDDKLMVRGHFDDLVLLPLMRRLDNVEGIDPSGNPELPKHLILYDYKSTSSRSFIYARTHGNEMSFYHLMQLGTYMYMLRNGNMSANAGKVHITDDIWKAIRNLEEARILKIEKDTLMMDEQQLLWSDKLEKQVVKYWTELNQEWKSKVMPPCTCANHENGFLAKEKYNPFYFNEQPCSMEWFKKSGIKYA